MLVKTGEKYCGEHAIFDERNQDRIPCPYDPKHTVNRKTIEWHLQRCNSRLLQKRWIVRNVNAIKGETRSTERIDRKATQEEIICALHKLQSCYNGIHNEIEKKQFHIPEIENFLKQFPQVSDSKRKHLLQQSSIIGHLESAKLLRNESSACIFELGAGKAQLSYWMAKRAPSASFLLIDRSGFRRRYDNKALQGVSSLCAVCKHFCGSATDAGIRCLSNGIEDGLALDGFMLVPCCHHKSRYTEYCGHDFLEKLNMNSEGDFTALRHISTWAVCGITKMQNGNGVHTNKTTSVDCHANEGEITENSLSEEISASQNDFELGTNEKRYLCDPTNDLLLPWSPKWKEEIGRSAKIVLETGRARHLAKLGFSTRVIEYVSSSITPENLLIVGVRQ